MVPRSAQRVAERAFDAALGLSALSWGVLGLLRAEDRPLSIRVAIAGLNLAVGVLFLVRRAPLAHGSAGAILSALPSMILGAAAVKLADDAPWPWPLQALFVAGAAGALASLLCLGARSRSCPRVGRWSSAGPTRSCATRRTRASS